MLTSLALIFLFGLLLGRVFELFKLPSLLGMIIAGIILSPHAFNLLDPSILDISADLRQIALIIILTRAGLSLNVTDLKRVGRPAFLMCFLPACFEIAMVILVAPKLLGLTILESAIMGSVIAAVSPAVIVPRMIRLIKEGYGRKNSIPQLIMAGASVDDVFVIVLFTVFTSLAVGGKITALDFLQIPVSIILGIIVGIISGLFITKIFKMFKFRDTYKVIIILSLSFLLLQFEKSVENIIAISALLSIMTIGITISKQDSNLAERLSAKYNKLWAGAEIILFVLVGATVDLTYVVQAGIPAILIILAALSARMLGVYASLLKSQITHKERLFTMIAYTPKATVQAAIGAIPLSMGLVSGQSILTVAILSILITAPFGAIGIDLLHKRLLEVE